jgi:hypothetical protein
MLSTEERERQLRHALHRWENEGGAIATDERSHPPTDDSEALRQAGFESR